MQQSGVESAVADRRCDDCARLDCCRVLERQVSSVIFAYPSTGPIVSVVCIGWRVLISLSRPLAPKRDSPEWKKATRYWATLKSDPGAKYYKVVLLNAADIVPTVRWGTSPQDVVPITNSVPPYEEFDGKAKQDSCRKALEYMGLKPGTKMEDIELDKIFIGSCTNARIEDLRAAAKIVEGKHIAKNLKRATIVPDSGLVKQQVEFEGLDRTLLDAGFEWREAGCSMCLGMNPDVLFPLERCASTRNRNFE